MNVLNSDKLQTCSLYAKYEGMTTFKAFDIENCQLFDKVIYATMMQNSEDNKKILKEIADDNKKISLILQLRNEGKVIFTTNN